MAPDEQCFLLFVSERIIVAIAGLSPELFLNQS